MLKTLSLAALLLSGTTLSAQTLSSCRAVADPAARLACYDRLADAPAAPAAAAPVAAPATPERFGLPESTTTASMEEIQSSVGASFNGWDPKSRIRLDNGQVWQIADGSSAALDAGARKVWVKRGALGSFFLKVEGLNHTPRVRRVE
jgi:hypothetical protein